MAKVTKDTMIGELLQNRRRYCTYAFKYWHALSRMPIFTDGNYC